jgi:hypothetical protein
VCRVGNQAAWLQTAKDWLHSHKRRLPKALELAAATSEKIAASDSMLEGGLF